MMPRSCAAWQGVGDLPRDRQRVTNGERTGCQTSGERASLHQFHDEELGIVRFFQTIECRDVWMGQAREDLRLAAEPRDAFGIGNRRRGEGLDGNVAAEACVACAIHLAHPARAKRRDDVVRTEAMSGWQRRHFVASAGPGMPAISFMAWMIPERCTPARSVATSARSAA